MKNAVVFMFARRAEWTVKSMMPSYRIARFVSEELQLPLEWRPEVGEQELDVLLIVNGNYGFVEDETRDGLAKAIERASRVVWIQNDYSIYPPTHSGNAESPFRRAFVTRHEEGKAPVDFWSTVLCMTRPGVTPIAKRIAGPGSRYLDWNTLTLDPSHRPEPMGARIHSDMVLYYGSFRQDREQYFDQYFLERPGDFEYCVASAAARSGKADKFAAKYGTREWMNFEDRIDDLLPGIGEYGGGLYLEDKRSHKYWMSVANRFYEMLSAGVPIFFHPKTESTLEGAGFDVEPWLARNSAEVGALMQNAAKIADEQRERLMPIAVERRESLVKNLHDAWRSL